MRSMLSCFSFLVVLTFVGCEKPVPVEASGDAIYNGEKMESGIISFIDSKSNKSAGGAPITKGRYFLDPDVGIPPGSYRVEIRWAKPTGELKEAGYGQSPIVTAEALPAKYHDESILTAELKPGKNEIHFNLEK